MHKFNESSIIIMTYDNLPEGFLLILHAESKIIMIRNINVYKHSGEKQPFSEDKLVSSIIRAGATIELAQEVATELSKMLYDGISTREIYRNAFRVLKKKVRALAARYSLKNAIMELGPSGYPFEKFVGEILRKEGYQVKTGQIIQGHCIQHEVDVIAVNQHLTIMAECKYGNDQRKVSGVQVPLYVNSRFQDIRQVWQNEPGNRDMDFEGWIVTNTRFSSDAETYGTCAGLNMVSWNFPERGNLKNLVEKHGLFPVTALTGLNRKQKMDLVSRDIILIDHLEGKPELLRDFDLTEKKIPEIMEEISALRAVARIL